MTISKDAGKHRIKIIALKNQKDQKKKKKKSASFNNKNHNSKYAQMLKLFNYTGNNSLFKLRFDIR